MYRPLELGALIGAFGLWEGTLYRPLEPGALIGAFGRVAAFRGLRGFGMHSIASTFLAGKVDIPTLGKLSSHLSF